MADLAINQAENPDSVSDALPQVLPDMPQKPPKPHFLDKYETEETKKFQDEAFKNPDLKFVKLKVL